MKLRLVRLWAYPKPTGRVPGVGTFEVALSFTTQVSIKTRARPKIALSLGT